jgi:hypothetical protein
MRLTGVVLEVSYRVNQLGELGRQRPSRARVYAGHAQDALRVIELLPVQIKDWYLHRASGLALLALRTFDRVSMHSKEAVLLSHSHDSTDWTYVATPESRDPPSSVDKPD